MKLSQQIFSNCYVISPQTKIHYMNRTKKVYGLFLILSLTPFLKNRGLKTVSAFSTMLFIYNKQLIHYFQDFKYIFLILLFYFLINIKHLILNNVQFTLQYSIQLMQVLPNYILRITHIIYIYFFLLRIITLTTPSEYTFNYLLYFFIKIIYARLLFIQIFILITSLSYQLLDRLIYNIHILQLFIKIHTHKQKYITFIWNKKLLLSLINKYIVNIFQDVEKISYTLYNRQLSLSSFYFHEK